MIATHTEAAPLEIVTWPDTALDQQPTMSPVHGIPDPETVYGPELPQIAYISGYVRIDDREIPRYAQMDGRDALRVTQVQHEFPGTRQLFPMQLLRVLQGGEATLHNRLLNGTHQLGARTRLSQAILTLP